MSNFKIAAAQVTSIRGDIERNIATHVIAAEAAIKQGVSVLIFPELSLTGYEPTLAAKLAMTAADERLAPLRTLARQHRMEVVVGVPLQNPAGKPWLGAFVFGSEGTIWTYAKMHLGGNEPEYFSPGSQPYTITANGVTTGLAICADASQSAHPQTYAEAGAELYAAGVFLTEEWYVTDAPRLAAYAARYRMLVVMANQADSVGTYTSIGKSAIWSPDGTRIAQANGPESALLIAEKSATGWTAKVVPLEFIA